MIKYITFLFITCCFLINGYCDESLVSPLFMKRHSGKAYDPSKQVSEKQKEALIQAARWAPSSHNDQPWNFIFCDKQLTPEAYENALRSLKEKQQGWVGNAPLLVVVTTRLQLIYKNKPNEWAEYDAGAAAISMALQASDMGLMAHQIGGFDKDKIHQDFQLPQNVKPLTIMVIGYESEPDPTPRDRRTIGDNFFSGKWGNGMVIQQEMSVEK